MFDPAPNLPDDTLIEMVRLSPSIVKSLNGAGLKGTSNNDDFVVGDPAAVA